MWRSIRRQHHLGRGGHGCRSAVRDRLFGGDMHGLRMDRPADGRTRGHMFVASDNITDLTDDIAAAEVDAARLLSNGDRSVHIAGNRRTDLCFAADRLGMTALRRRRLRLNPAQLFNDGAQLGDGGRIVLKYGDDLLCHPLLALRLVGFVFEDRQRRFSLALVPETALQHAPGASQELRRRICGVLADLRQCAAGDQRGDSRYQQPGEIKQLGGIHATSNRR